jgi:hypothetical protein
MAAKNFGRVNVSITASTGGLTAGLGRASKQLGGFAGQAQGIGGRLTAMAAGFVGAGRSATVAAIGVRALGMAVKSLLAPLLILTSLVSIFAAFGRAAKELEVLDDLSQELGVASGELQVLGKVAEEAGASQEMMVGGLRRTSRMVGQLASGAPGATKAFERLGLTMNDMAGLSTAQQFELISQRIAALPPHMQAAAAINIFGRSGQGLLNFIRQGSTAIGEMDLLMTNLGVKLRNDQVAGIALMGDAMGRLSLVTQGFINQFLAELAPAIATVGNLIVKFFADNTSGWNMATTLASAFGQAIRGVAGAVTFLYGAFQVLSAFLGVFITGALGAFSAVTEAIGNMLSAMADAAEALPGMDVGVASGLRNAADSVSGLSTAAGDEAELWGQAAAENFADGVRNMSDPFAAFDAEFASVTAKMQQAGAAAGAAAGETAGSGISAAIAASGQALKAIVVGTGEGEAFRNSIMRGADPRLEGAKDQARTADAAEQSAESLEEIEASLSGLGGGIGLATISV